MILGKKAAMLQSLRDLRRRRYSDLCGSATRGMLSNIIVRDHLHNGKVLVTFLFLEKRRKNLNEKSIQD